MESGTPYSFRNCNVLDQGDVLAGVRKKFAFPGSGSIHFDANSMGAMPAEVPDRVSRVLADGWRDLGRRSWGSEPWLDRPRTLGAAIAPILGARPDDVVVCDNTTINLFKCLGYAWKIRGSGHVILTETHNFPTDLHVAQGYVRLLSDLGVEVEIRLAETRQQLLDMLDRDVAILYLTQTDYRSSARWNMADVNACARAVDALTLWDLSHSAGAVGIDLTGSGSDFAVGCGYKYLCGGPGGPAFLYVSARHQGAAWPVIAGWMGHARWDEFLPDFEPAEGAGRHLTGTPAVVANEIFSAAADIWCGLDPRTVAAKHESLTETLIALLDQECERLGVEINSPRAYEERGGHVSFSHQGAGSVCEALAHHGLVSSFRYPDSIRLGMSPLYHSHEDVWNAVQIIRNVLETEVWRESRFANVSI